MSFEGKDLVNNETDVYYIKYLKYKQKYLDLKEQLGGRPPSAEELKRRQKLMDTTTPYYEFTNNSVVKGKLYLYTPSLFKNLLYITKATHSEVEQHNNLTITKDYKSANYTVEGDYLNVDKFLEGIYKSEGKFNYNYYYPKTTLTGYLVLNGPDTEKKTNVLTKLKYIDIGTIGTIDSNFKNEDKIYFSKDLEEYIRKEFSKPKK